MMRVLTALAAVAALPAVAYAQAAAPPTSPATPSAFDDFEGVVVPGQPRDAYVIRINVAGKDELTVRREIWEAAWVACNRAPRTTSPLDARPFTMQWCATEASWNATMQYNEILENRRQDGAVDVAAY